MISVEEKERQLIEDLASRFVVNIPSEEFSSLERVYFQIEAAHWFYLDFYCEMDHSLTRHNLKRFSKLMIYQVDCLRQYVEKETNFDELYARFTQYKITVPVCGGILLNYDMTKCLMVKGWKAKSTWGFPRGKINKDEPEKECARREVYEETGYMIEEDQIKEEDHILHYKGLKQRVKLYIINQIDTGIEFKPRTRKEISDIQWHSIQQLSKDKKAYHLVIPFIKPLKRWIKHKRKADMKQLSHLSNPKRDKKIVEKVTLDSFMEVLMGKQRPSQHKEKAKLSDQANRTVENYLHSLLVAKELEKDRVEQHPWKSFQFINICS